jgi:hypothetical protein
VAQASGLCSARQGPPTVWPGIQSHVEKIDPAPASPANQTTYQPIPLPANLFPHYPRSIIESKDEFHESKDEFHHPDFRQATSSQPPECAYHRDYHQLCAALEAEWQPQTPTERFYLETMSTSHWLLARADSSEERIYAARLGPATEGALLGRVAARRTRLLRAYTATMHELQQLQKERQDRQQHQPPVQAQSTAKTAQPPAPPPGYVMSDAAQSHPAFSTTATTDTR